MANNTTRGGIAFETAKLSGFQLGDPDAKVDDLLLSCPQSIRGVKEFLAGSKNIVLGERGAGKSALFRLVTEGKYSFSGEHLDKYKHLVIGIDDDLDYIAISNAIEVRFADSAKRKYGKYRFLWEIYVLSRVLERMVEQFGADEELKTLQEDFGSVLGLPRAYQFRLNHLWTKYKFSSGVKVDQTGAVVPTISVEPSKDAHSDQREISDHELAGLLDRVRKAIKARRAVVHVLVDKVDDFVVGRAYEEQKQSVQALVECTQAMRYPELKLKIFLRVDMFRRLDFEKGGYDKVEPQVVQLQWTSEDICGFVARRLLHNYERLEIKTPSWGVSLEMLDVDPSLKQQARDLFSRRSHELIGTFRKVGKAIAILAKMKWELFKKRSHSERKTNSLDAVSFKIVSFIFPTKVDHLNASCKKESIPFQSFLSEHFKLGGDYPNPRLVLLFLNYTLAEAVSYYDRNPDHGMKFIQANEIGEYELILREHILRGYRRLQTTARETVAQLDLRWRSEIASICSSLPRPQDCASLSIEDIKRLSGWAKDDDELRRFVAFYTHIGFLVPENANAPLATRKFSLPLVMRICP